MNLLDNKQQATTIVVVDSNDQLRHQIGKESSEISQFSDSDFLLDAGANINPEAIYINFDGSYKKPLFEAVANIKDKWPFCPLILVTNNVSESQLPLTLASGADDFIKLPLDVAEIQVRQTVISERLTQKAAVQIVEFGDIVIDARQRTITGPKGKAIASPIEINLLNHLANSGGNFVKKEALKIHCWGQIKVTDNALHRKLHAVRQLLKEVSEDVIIRTKYGVGFTLSYQEPRITQLAS